MRYAACALAVVFMWSAMPSCWTRAAVDADRSVPPPPSDGSAAAGPTCRATIAARSSAGRAGCGGARRQG